MRHLLTLISIALLFSSCVKDRVIPAPTVIVPTGGPLIHYWNFNNDAITPTSTVGGGSLHFDFTTVGSTTGYQDFTGSTASSQNAQNNDSDGDALRVRNPSVDMIITAPTTGYKNIVISYAVEASSLSNAPLTDSVYYTTDGTNYINTGLSAVTYNLTNFVDPAYALVTFDLSSIPAVNNNANFKFKITFSNGNLNISGNTRFDNITVEGVSISTGSGGNAPVITSGTTASGTINSVFAGYTITASNSPTSYSIGGALPAGLMLNTATGVISGTPTATGTFVDTVKATNATGTGTQILTITINSPASIVLMDYWNFNTDAIIPTSTVGGGSLHFDFTTVGSTTGSQDFVASTASSQNAQDNDPDGDALRVRNPSVDMIITAPTTGYKNIVISYAVEASSASFAPLTDSVYYTTDGTTYINTGLAAVTYNLTNFVDPTYALATFDLSTIPVVNNNANFKFKITFSNGNLNTSGNTRFDNITVEGYPQ